MTDPFPTSHEGAGEPDARMGDESKGTRRWPWLDVRAATNRRAVAFPILAALMTAAILLVVVFLGALDGVIGAGQSFVMRVAMQVCNSIFSAISGVF